MKYCLTSNTDNSEKSMIHGHKLSTHPHCFQAVYANRKWASPTLAHNGTTEPLSTAAMQITRELGFHGCSSMHWPSSYCFTPKDHQVARIFLVLLQPIRRALSKTAFSELILFTSADPAADDPFRRRSVTVFRRGKGCFCLWQLHIQA